MTGSGADTRFRVLCDTMSDTKKFNSDSAYRERKKTDAELISKP